MKGILGALALLLASPLGMATLEIPKDILQRFQVAAMAPKVQPAPIPAPAPSGDDYPKEYLANDRQSALLWKSARPKIFLGEEMELEIDYFGVAVGKATLKTLENKFVDGRESAHLRLDLKSAPFYEKVYRIRDYGETFWDVKAFLPLRSYANQDESKQKVTDLQLFDHPARKTYTRYKRKKRKKNKDEGKVVSTPGYFQDFLGSLLLVRGLPLEKGKVYGFPLVSRGKVGKIRIEVTGRERVKVAKKKYRAIRLQVETSFPKSGKGGKKKKSSISLWLSDDDVRKILRFDAKAKLGRIKGWLRRYREGRRSAK